MVDPLKPYCVGIKLGPERTLVEHIFGALIDDRALLARERRGLGVALDEILANFGANKFEHETQMPNDGIVALNRMMGLLQIAQANHDQQDRPERPGPLDHSRRGQCDEQQTAQDRQLQNKETTDCH